MQRNELKTSLEMTIFDQCKSIKIECNEETKDGINAMKTWRDDGDGDALDPNEADEAGKTAADVEAHMRQRDRKSGFKMDEVDEQEIEEYYRNRYSFLLVTTACLSYPLLRYNEDTAAIQRFGEGGEEMSDEITQQTLLPEVKDPNLWMVKCR